MHEILNAIWTQIQPMVGDIIIAIITTIIGYIGLPKLINKGLGFLFQYIPYKPVEAMAWGLVRHVADKYEDLPGEEKAEKIFNEIKEHYPWFPSQSLLAVIKTQYRIWRGELVQEKKRQAVGESI